jgi:flagellar hook-associated protein 2
MLAGSSSDEQAVGVSVGTTATAGDYDIVVNELARAQVTVSASSAPDANTTIVANAGTLTIGGVDVAIAGDVTLQQLATTINGTAGIGVTAAVLKTGTNTYRLVLSGKQAGVANAFTVAGGLTGGTGVSFTDTDNDGLSGNSAADNAVTATDASLLFNNVLVTGDSNTFADIVPGVTLTVHKKDPATTIQVGVSTDGTSLKTANHRLRHGVQHAGDLRRRSTGRRRQRRPDEHRPRADSPAALQRSPCVAARPARQRRADAAGRSRHRVHDLRASSN